MNRLLLKSLIRSTTIVALLPLVLITSSFSNIGPNSNSSSIYSVDQLPFSFRSIKRNGYFNSKLDVDTNALNDCLFKVAFYATFINVLYSYTDLLGSPTVAVTGSYEGDKIMIHLVNHSHFKISPKLSLYKINGMT